MTAPSTLHARGTAMIEVGSTSRCAAPSARGCRPPSSVAEDVLACAAAGASVAHYHARDAEGTDLCTEVASTARVLGARPPRRT